MARRVAVGSLKKLKAKKVSSKRLTAKKAMPTKKRASKKVTKKSTKKVVAKKFTEKKPVITKKVKPKKTLPAAEKKVSTGISVEKKKGGILIKVSNPEVLAELINAFNVKRIGEETIQTMETAKLVTWLETLSAPNLNSFKVAWNSDLFRVCNKDYKAYSISGSLSCGGRLNLGGSQKRKEFPNLKPFGALYFSEEIDTAIKEYADSAPLGPADFKYKVELKKSFDLWEYDKVIDLLGAYPGLKETVRSTPMNAIWSNCKIPMPSQVIACWLKSYGGDGFIFESTKSAGKKNIVLIFKDDAEAKKHLLLTQI